MSIARLAAAAFVTFCVAGAAEAETAAQTAAAPAEVTRPEARGTVIETVRRDGQFKTFVAAARAAGLTQVLAGRAKITLLVPTDSAFEALPDGLLDTLMEYQNRSRLESMLSRHLIARSVNTEAMAEQESVRTMEGLRLPVSAEDGRVTMLGEAHLLEADIETSNGYLHVVDRIFVPDELLAGTPAGDAAAERN